MNSEPKNRAGRRNILFVCYGNICRSPAAQGIFETLAAQRGLAYAFEADSAGTHDFHIGKAPDARSIAACRRAGVDIGSQRARQVENADFERFDWIVVMDDRNAAFLHERCPAPLRERIVPLAGFGPTGGPDHIPDPFRGEPSDFEDMVELLFDCCAALLDRMQRRAA